MPNEISDRKKLIASSRRVVIKLGTAVLMNEASGFALSRFYSFVESIARLHKSGKEILIVSSGAVGLGVQILGLEKRPRDLPMIQACAAVGQGNLLKVYAEAFEKLGIKTAQVLLSEEDFSNRQRYLNLRSTISALIKMGVIPVINENDTVSTSEIESLYPTEKKVVNFGDNDKLSALVTSEMDADLLIVLTDVDGVYSKDPNLSSEAELIETIDDLTPFLIEEETDPVANVKTAHTKGRGGIKSKLEAAKIVTHTGSSCIIANGSTHQIIDKIFDSESLGTLILSRKHMTGKSKWIAYATKPAGALSVNQGAKDALTGRKASLLPAGIIQVDGSFDRGDVVRILDENNEEFARGLTNYSSEETSILSGKHSDLIDKVIENRNYDAVITRDNIAFTND